MARWDRPTESSVPEWFWQAVETQSEKGTVEVDECDVFYQSWGDPSKPGMLLIHGMYAHCRWWDFIAPQLLDQYHIAAMDLTGMGDSDFRYSYSAEGYAQEMVAVCDSVGFDDDVTIVGHSFGGIMAAKAANLVSDRFGALVLVDSGIRHPDEPIPERAPVGRGRPRAYPDREIAESRFRLLPPQTCENRYIIEYIAKQSLMRVNGGWAWKFDEELPLTLKGGERYPEDYSSLSLPVGIIYGKQSASFSERTRDYMLELMGSHVPVVGLENAQHHVFLDQPLDFIKALGVMAADLHERSP